MDKTTNDKIRELIKRGRQDLTSTTSPILTSTPAKPSPPPEPLCPTCNTPAEVGLFRVDVPPGHPQFGKPIQCDDPFHAEARAKRLAAVSNLGPEDVKRRLSDIQPEAGNRDALSAARASIERGYGWLYIWGGPGNAKSEILKAMVNQINEAGQGPAVYTTLGTILDHIRQGYVMNDYLERYQRLVDSPVLAVDEMDKIKNSDWVEEFRFKFLDARYTSAVNKQTLTVFAGQKHPKSIFDDPVYDRFRDGRFCIVENKAQSARPGMRWA